MSQKWEGGRIPEEPDTCVFGTGGLLFGRVVGSPGVPSEERLATLLRSVNSHEALLAACKAALTLDLEPDPGSRRMVLVQIMAAIAAAEGAS